MIEQLKTCWNVDLSHFPVEHINFLLNLISAWALLGIFPLFVSKFEIFFSEGHIFLFTVGPTDLVKGIFWSRSYRFFNYSLFSVGIQDDESIFHSNLFFQLFLPLNKIVYIVETTTTKCCEWILHTCLSFET